MISEELCSRVVPGILLQHCQPIPFSERWAIFIRYLSIVEFPWVVLLVAGIIGGLVIWFIQRHILSHGVRLALSLAVVVAVILTPFLASYLGSGICLPMCTVAVPMKVH